MTKRETSKFLTQKNKYKTVDIEENNRKMRCQEQQNMAATETEPETWKQLSKQTQNACQQNTVTYITYIVVFIFVLFFLLSPLI